MARAQPSEAAPAREDLDTSRSPRRTLGDMEMSGWHDAAESKHWNGASSGWTDSDPACQGSASNGWSSWDATEQGKAETEQQWEATEPGRPWYIDAHDLVLEPSDAGAHRFTAVGLHSCSGGPDDFVPFFHNLDVPFRSQIRLVVPCSPVRLENHYGWEKEQNSWFEYDGDSQDGNAVKHLDQLLEQRVRLLRLLERERSRLPDGDGRRLIIWGLSQGAGLALDVALHAPFAVGGVLALRGMALPGRPARPAPAEPVQVLAINGVHDWLCPPDVARASYEALSPHGARLSFVAEPTLGHACARGRQKLNAPELRRVNAFLREVWGGL